MTPRHAADILALLDAQSASEETVLEVQPVILGKPADADTSNAITALVRELEACINSGDHLRLYALFSDALFQQIQSEEAVAEMKAEIQALASATPTPVPSGQRQVLVGPWYVQQLDDGRVMAAVLFKLEGEAESYPSATKVLFFTRGDGDWLIEEMVDTIWVEGKDRLVAVEEIVGPPPGS